MKTKVCLHCETEKILERDFNKRKNPNATMGYQAWCRECCHTYNNARRKKLRLEPKTARQRQPAPAREPITARPLTTHPFAVFFSTKRVERVQSVVVCDAALNDSLDADIRKEFGYALTALLIDGGIDPLRATKQVILRRAVDARELTVAAIKEKYQECRRRIAVRPWPNLGSRTDSKNGLAKKPKSLGQNLTDQLQTLYAQRSVMVAEASEKILAVSVNISQYEAALAGLQSVDLTEPQPKRRRGRPRTTSPPIRPLVPAELAYL